MSSCSTIVFQSQQEIPVYMSSRSDHDHRVIIEGHKDFYLWGMVPTEHVISLDRLFADEGLVSVTNLRIKENITGIQMLKSFLTFGMYSPVNYEVTGFGVKAKDE